MARVEFVRAKEQRTNKSIDDDTGVMTSMS